VIPLAQENNKRDSTHTTRYIFFIAGKNGEVEFLRWRERFYEYKEYNKKPEIKMFPVSP
jgi:hypothetical protein